VSAQTTPITPYHQAFLDAVDQLRREGWNAFRIEDVATRMNRKPTTSLRRRLSEAAAAGLVRPYSYYTERGGLAKAYWIEQQLPLPGVEQHPW
jgi:hypothetical protein